MRVIYRWPTRGLALLLLLLGSCSPNNEQPNPAKTPASGVDVSPLRQAFLSQHYDAQLTQQAGKMNQPNGTWTWTLQWNRASQTTAPDSAIYTYVPLEARLPTPPYVVTLVGMRRYLLIKQSRHGLDFSLLSYLKEPPKAKTRALATLETTSQFFAAFTGTALLKDLATGEGAHFIYHNGVLVRLPKPQGAARQVCVNYYTCYWYSSCTDANNNYVTYGTMTGGIDGCSEPGYEPCSNWGMSWNSNGQTIDPQCTDVPDPPFPEDPQNPGSPGTTDPDPGSPCDQMTTLAVKSGFQMANASAIAMTQGSIERGYVFRNGGNASTDFEPLINGGPNDADWPRIMGWEYDGMIHTHPGGLSVFSMSDIQTIYEVAAEGYMHDPATFTMIVYTSYGDDYAIKITDFNQFLNFAPKIVDEDAVRAFERNYISTPPPLYPFVYSSSLMNEQSLLRIFRDFNTGLTLLKHDRASDTWQPRGLDVSNSPINTPCQ